MSDPGSDSTVERHALTVKGIVQGVGFRPHVYALASRLGLSGFVANRAGSVRIEVEGAREALAAFAVEVVRQAPALALIEEVVHGTLATSGEREFRIADSEVDDAGAVLVSPDVATCAACLQELFDPACRRYRYPFVNCAHCGPRITIVRGAPYDRERTTMSAFAMCAACRAEYDDPTDRRFHAQPIACPACGPRLRAIDGRTGEELDGHAIERARDELGRGRIGAIKGLGGYHLACDATSEQACRGLRERKERDEKPFALLVADVESAGRLAFLSERERAVLESPARAIVLVRRRPATDVAPSVAPGSSLLGLMLPYTPLHHLLARAVSRPIVLTSGNRSDEPIAFTDEDARARLSSIADFFLVHDRPIHTRCDDSVVRVAGDRVALVRRSRGYAPAPVPLAFEVERPTIALGGQLKATFALAHGRRAIVSHHLGDLDHYAAYRAYVDAIAQYEDLFRLRVARAVHDVHPDYASTRLAASLAAERGLELVAVQHHRAHVASVLAEHGLACDGVIGVAFDGAGWGDDGAVWGGEVFVAKDDELTRAAHLDYVRMPGGARAMREPWRMAVAHLRSAEEGLGAIEARVGRAELRLVDQLLQSGANAPLTSSVGRLFDAVASIAGVRDAVTFEGQAAIALEMLAAEVEEDEAYPSTIDDARGGAWVIETRPLVRAAARDAARGVAAAKIARRFHSGLVALVVDVCERLRASSGASTVALGGGVFVNAILSTECAKHLADACFDVYLPMRLPANDGGLCLGQLALAASKTARVASRGGSDVPGGAGSSRRDHA